jgi:hypothetical protein
LKIIVSYFVAEPKESVPSFPFGRGQDAFFGSAVKDAVLARLGLEIFQCNLFSTSGQRNRRFKDVLPNATVAKRDA